MASDCPSSIYYKKKKHGTVGWGKASMSLSYVVFEKDVFVRWVRCLALYCSELKFLSAFPSPSTSWSRGTAEEQEEDDADRQS